MVVTLTLNLREASDSAFLADGVKAAVAGVTTAGFSIVLDAPAPRDLTYSWIAMEVANMRTVVGTPSALAAILPSAEQAQTATPSATPTPILIESQPATASAELPITSSHD